MSVEEDVAGLFDLFGKVMSGEKTLVQLADEALGNKQLEVVVTTADDVTAHPGKPGMLLRVVPRGGGASASDPQPAPAVTADTPPGPKE